MFLLLANTDLFNKNSLPLKVRKAIAIFVLIIQPLRSTTHSKIFPEQNNRAKNVREQFHFDLNFYLVRAKI